jgi:hypothetical protein
LAMISLGTPLSINIGMKEICNSDGDGAEL